jgi:hypothetical protein
MLAGAMTVWFILTGASLLFVLIDFRNTPVSWVQKLAWGLVIAYTGPVGLFVYLLACRNPGPGLHDAFTKPMWKQAVNSEMHCLAGDATGIIIAAAVLSAFAMPWGWELAIEYVAGYISGLLIFQAMMMRSMFASYGEAVKRTVFAETVSMNMVMVGMIPAMVLLAAQWPESDSPAHWSFWFRMGIAAVAGGLTAYPVNHWLVARGFKHGCMTVRGGGSNADARSTHVADGHGHGDMRHESPSAHDHMGHASHGDHAHHSGASHAMPAPTRSQIVVWVLVTTLALAASVVVTTTLR